jgi:hypothetical protein
VEVGEEDGPPDFFRVYRVDDGVGEELLPGGVERVADARLEGGPQAVAEQIPQRGKDISVH